MPSGIEITTVMILLRHSRVEEAHKTELKKEMLFFSGVTLIDPQLIRWNTIAPVQSGHAGYHRARDRRSASMNNKTENQEYSTMTLAEKNHFLYLKQKAMLDTFLAKGAITQAEHDKSLHDLTVKMGEAE